MRRGVKLVGLGLAVAALVGVAWLSAAPIPVLPADDVGLLRLSWRLRGDAGEEACRRPTPEELAELPPHMRNPDACVGRGVAFSLEVGLDDEPVLADTVRPAGARGDRPVFVSRELEVRPGTHRLTVLFEPLGESGARGYRLERSVRFEPRRVLLVTWDAQAERLVVRRE